MPNHTQPSQESLEELTKTALGQLIDVNAAQAVIEVLDSLETDNKITILGSLALESADAAIEQGDISLQVDTPNGYAFIGVYENHDIDAAILTGVNVSTGFDLIISRADSETLDGQNYFLVEDITLSYDSLRKLVMGEPREIRRSYDNFSDSKDNETKPGNHSPEPHKEPVSFEQLSARLRELTDAQRQALHTMIGGSEDQAQEDLGLTSVTEYDARELISYIRTTF